MMKLTEFLKRPRQYLPLVKIDLRVGKHHQTAFGLSILVFVLILFLAAISDFAYSRYQITQLTLSLQPAGESERFPPRKMSDEQLTAVRNAHEQLSIPWGSLFLTLEAIQSDKVVLISIEPDPQKKRVRILAEAPDVYEMLEYVKAISGQPGIRNLHISSQKNSDNQETPAIRFVLDGDWGAQ